MLPAGTIACVRCGKHLPALATFCDGCGARAAQYEGGPAPIAAPITPAMPTARPGFVAAGRGMAICHACGVIAPTRLSNCEGCGAPIGTSLEAVPPRDDGAYWVQVRTEMVCRQCGQRSPLDPLDVDGSVTCGRCNAIQAFDPTAWTEALAHAHAVGDLGGPDLVGKNAAVAGRNRHAQLGVSTAASEHLVSGLVTTGGVMKTRNIAISASPGHPLCGRCGCVVAIDVRGNEVASRCTSCGDAAQYRFPIGALALAPGLVAAIGDELRTDRPAARLDATSAGAVIAIRCPSCGAGLEVTDGKHFATCTYCSTHCRIPQRTLLALRQGSQRADPWWVLFRGPSAERTQLLTPRSAVVDTDEGDDDDDRPRRRKATKLALIEQPPMERGPRDEMLAWALQITVPVLLLAIVGAAIRGNTVLKWLGEVTTSEQNSSLVIAPYVATRDDETR